MGIKVGGNDAGLFILPTGMMRADVQLGKAGGHSGPPKDVISEPSLDHSPFSHDSLSKPERKISEGQKEVPENAQLRKEALPEDMKLQKAEVKQNHSNPFWNLIWDEAPTQGPRAKSTLFGRRNQVMAGLVFIISLNVGLLGAGIMAYIMVKKRDANTPAVPITPTRLQLPTAKADADSDGAASDSASSFAASSIGPTLSQSAFTGAGGSVSGPAQLVLDPEECAGCGTEYAPAAANCRKCGIPRVEEDKSIAII